MLSIHAVGQWGPGDVTVRWGPTSRRSDWEVEQRIEQAWAEAGRRLGERLFDGPMCRLESFQASDARLELVLSHTSYKPFLGTNLSNPELADRHGADILANPVGVSSALETADGYLLFGRRNDSVAYYPNRIHPFAGALEPREGLDVFEEVYRELDEELALRREDLEQIHCRGVVEDLRLRQPELIFTVRTVRTRQQIEAQVDPDEHHASWALPAERPEVEQAMSDTRLTPIAVATLLLWGGARFGQEWVEHQRRNIAGAS